MDILSVISIPDECLLITILNHSDHTVTLQGWFVLGVFQT